MLVNCSALLALDVKHVSSSILGKFGHTACIRYGARLYTGECNPG